MKVERTGHGAFALSVSAVELSALMAAVRMAADTLEGDDRTPPEAVAALRALLRDYERAAVRLRDPDERSSRPSGTDSPGSAGS